MRYLVAILLSVLVLNGALLPQHTHGQIAPMAGPASPDLETAIRSYAEAQGAVFRGECAAVQPGTIGGLCYEAALRDDGTAEVWLGRPFTGGIGLVLFDHPDDVWEPFTRSQPVGDTATQLALNAQWSDVVGSWPYAGQDLIAGPGRVYASFNADGSGVLTSGRFPIAEWQLDAFQDGIAVGTLTPVSAEVDPTTQAITGVVPGSPSKAAFMLFTDGTALLTSLSPFEHNLQFQRRLGGP
jgi:hypothetical protein